MNILLNIEPGETQGRIDVIRNIDSLRLSVNKRLEPTKKAELGQYMTPNKIADFMAKLFEFNGEVNLLDCGAGIGSLTIAVVKQFQSVQSADLWEVDPEMVKHLQVNMESLAIPFQIHNEDFIIRAVSDIQLGQGKRYTHAILNPPYKKISSSSKHRQHLQHVGIETVNLYTAFLALTIMLMTKGGQVVAIIPRSFCNGPYYKPFRNILLENCSIDHIHIFESRRKAFRDDDVLQENIILKLTKGKPQKEVMISSSEDQLFIDYSERKVNFREIVKKNDQEIFIHIPLSEGPKNGDIFNSSLNDIGLQVSTGPVVDFRVKEFWEQNPNGKTIPLIYPHHFKNYIFNYPQIHKKPNALRNCPEVIKWTMPKGYYVLVKRFSAKEEKRRVVAFVIKPEEINANVIGFENHWNVFHVKKAGLDQEIAYGLACFLNSTLLDDYFRVFSGHTQVNATDLKNLKYPTIGVIQELGKKYKPSMKQKQIDDLIQGII